MRWNNIVPTVYIYMHGLYIYTVISALATPMRALSRVLFLSLALTVAAHQEPRTGDEIEAQRALQAAAYYVSTLISVHHCLILSVASAHQQWNVSQQRANVHGQPKSLQGNQGFQVTKIYSMPASMTTNWTLSPLRTRPSWAVHRSQPPKFKTTPVFSLLSSPKARTIIKLAILFGRILQSTKMGYCWCVRPPPLSILLSTVLMV